MQRRHLLSLVVLGLAMSLGFVLLVRHRASEPSSTALEPTASDSGLSGVALAPSDEDMRVAPPIGTDQRVPAAPLEEPAVVQLDPTRKVQGCVIFPKGTPSDEQVEVVLEYLPTTTEGDRDGSREFFGPWKKAASVPASPDGSFVLALPQSLDAARVTLTARYLYLETGVKVANLSSPTRLELAPRLGAHVTFVLVPPADATRDPNCLVGRQIQMSHIPRNELVAGQAPTIELTVAPDLTLEAGGLPADDQFTICRRAAMFAEGQDLSPFVVAGDWDPVLTAGVRCRIEIPLIEGASVSGMARDDTGAPLEGVLVQVVCATGNATAYWYDNTDADGRFALEAINPRFQIVQGQKEGFLSATLQGSALGDGLQRSGLELVLTRKTGAR